MTTFSLFIGAFLDALIGPNLFVPGEPFLIAAGYQLHQGIYIGLLAVLLGGFLGDQISYFIGFSFGHNCQRKLTQWRPKSRRAIARSRLLMRTKGIYILAFARLLGPVAWVVPCIAGTNKIPWTRFTLYSLIGLFLGVGQFVMWGYLLAYGLENYPLFNELKTFIIEHQYSLIAIGVTCIFLYIGIKRRFRHLIIKTALILLTGVAVSNYGHFFWLADDFQKTTNIETKSYIKTEDIIFKAYPGKSSFFDAQAINVLYIGSTPKTLMHKLGWLENKSFSYHDLELKDYIDLLIANTPPVSDLFWNQRPQELAFQLPGTLLSRSHIRWWQAGIDPESKQAIWLGAISYDNGLTITPYSGILTVLHSIDPDVDAQRDQLANQIQNQLSNKAIGFMDTSEPISVDDHHDYRTDGRVLVINENA